MKGTKRKRMHPAKNDAFILVVNFGGADDADSRWGDVSIVPMAALTTTPTSNLKRLISQTKASTPVDEQWNVRIDTTHMFPSDEDTRSILGDKSATKEAEDEIGWEIADLSGLNVVYPNIVGKVVYHTQM